MLVAQSKHIDDAVLAPKISFTEALKDSQTVIRALRVGFCLVPGHPRKRAKNWLTVYCDRDGTKADGVVMGYWDRPFDEAVELLNEWLTRYKTA